MNESFENRPTPSKNEDDGGLEDVADSRFIIKKSLNAGALAAGIAAAAAAVPGDVEAQGLYNIQRQPARIEITQAYERMAYNLVYEVAKMELTFDDARGRYMMRTKVQVRLDKYLENFKTDQQRGLQILAIELLKIGSQNSLVTQTEGYKILSEIVGVTKRSSVESQTEHSRPISNPNNLGEQGGERRTNRMKDW